MTHKKQHIVIIGAGFAGLMAAVRLGRKHKHYPIDITLVNASDEYIIRPRLHEWASNQTHERQKIVDILDGTGVNFKQGWVTDLQAKENQVTVSTTNGEEVITYDTLIYALGSRINTTAIAGIEEHAYVFDAHAENGAEHMRQAIKHYENKVGQVVVIGGGATGIEGATHIKSLYPHLDVTLVTREAFGSFKENPRIRKQLQAAFQEQHITVVENVTVREIQAKQIVLEDGDTLPFDLCVWAGGFTVPELGRDAGLQVNAHNQVLIDPYQRALDYPNIFAVGDSAYPIKEPGAPYRMCCPVALTMGAHAADTILRQLDGKTLQPLSFSYYGQGIQLGINDAIGWASTPDDKVRWFPARKAPALLIRKSIISFLDVIFDYEKRFGFYNWLGKKRYQKQQAKLAEQSSELSGQSA